MSAQSNCFGKLKSSTLHYSHSGTCHLSHSNIYAFVIRMVRKKIKLSLKIAFFRPITSFFIIFFPEPISTRYRRSYCNSTLMKSSKMLISSIQITYSHQDFTHSYTTFVFLRPENKNDANSVLWLTPGETLQVHLKSIILAVILR